MCQSQVPNFTSRIIPPGPCTTRTSQTGIFPPSGGFFQFRSTFCLIARIYLSRKVLEPPLIFLRLQPRLEFGFLALLFLLGKTALFSFLRLRSSSARFALLPPCVCFFGLAFFLGNLRASALRFFSATFAASALRFCLTSALSFSSAFFFLAALLASSFLRFASASFLRLASASFFLRFSSAFLTALVQPFSFFSLPFSSARAFFLAARSLPSFFQSPALRLASCCSCFLRSSSCFESITSACTVLATCPALIFVGLSTKLQVYDHRDDDDRVEKPGKCNNARGCLRNSDNTKAIPRGRSPGRPSQRPPVATIPAS